MERKVFSVQGAEVRTIELNDTVFGLPINEDVVYYAINNELANARLGTACTKDRGEVHGSNAKPFAQKGTGRARQGDKKSPLLVGGGTIFGPKPRDYSFKLPKKVKRLAMKTILSMKVQQNRLKVVEDFSVDTGKTKDLVSLLKNLGSGERTIIVLKDEDAKLKQAARNIPWVKFLSYRRLRAHDLFYGRNVIMMETAAKNLNTFFEQANEVEE
jgi:large subunit ribosomal protein L4